MKNNTDSIHTEQVKPYLLINKLSPLENNKGFIGKNILYKENLFIADFCSIFIMDKQNTPNFIPEVLIITENAQPYPILEKEKTR
ncbi:MAG: hypothetical protein LIO65_02700 [Odoribacter sp.]|nr:hypothetical protein [Odoribacter sp.]